MDARPPTAHPHTIAEVRDLQTTLDGKLALAGETGWGRMIVVSEPSCISNLLSVAHGTLLLRLFGEVLIPPAVERELLRFHAGLPEFLKRVAPTDQARLSRLRQELDPGEAETTCLGCAG